jgi:hypothetical protein
MHGHVTPPTAGGAITVPLTAASLETKKAAIGSPFLGERPKVLEPNRDAIGTHLHALFPAEFLIPFPDAQIEIIYGPPGIFTVSRWFSAFDVKAIVDFVEVRVARGDNVYVGAALRQGPIPETGRANGDENYLAGQHGWSEYEGAGTRQGCVRCSPVDPDPFPVAGG